MFKKILESVAGRYLFSGVWFAAAALIPVAYYMVRFGDGAPNLGGSVYWTATVPLIAAGILGMLLGTSILETGETKNVFHASLKGLAVALISFLALFVIPAVMGIFLSPDPVGSIVLSGVLFLYGFLLVGWLAAIAGTVGGALLYLLQLRLVSARSELQ